MKKFTIIILTLILMFSLGACNDNKESQSENESKKTEINNENNEENKESNKEKTEDPGL